MRSIEFRAWDTETNEMLYAKDANKFGKHYITFTGKVVQPAILKPCLLMQFTGLLDKNGVKIFEGDLLIFKNDIDAIFECFYHCYQGAFSIARVHYQGNRCGGYCPPITSDYLSVIGNIYQNTELLENKQ